MEKILEKYTRVITYVLLITGMIYTGFQVLELIWELLQGFAKRFTNEGLNYVPQYFRPVAVLFFNILLLLEILETIKVFDRAHEVKIKLILIVCLIAVSRKVLVMDATGSDPVAELAVAALILAFAVSYFLVRRMAGKSEGNHD